MKIVKIVVNPEPFCEWSRIVDELLVLQATIEDHCSSMLPDDLFRALVSGTRLLVFSEFLPK